MTTTRQKTAVTLLAGLAIGGILTGCSAAESVAEAEEIAPDSSTTETAETPAADTATSTYADGTYTESGRYQTPNGTETVEVTITLASDVVTAVTVTGDATSRDSQQYQSQFISGISSVVVGKDIDEISVTKVAGSSLTSSGFTAAIDAIKADAS